MDSIQTIFSLNLNSFDVTSSLTPDYNVIGVSSFGSTVFVLSDTFVYIYQWLADQSPTLLNAFSISTISPSFIVGNLNYIFLSSSSSISFYKYDGSYNYSFTNELDLVNPFGLSIDQFDDDTLYVATSDCVEAISVSSLTIVGNYSCGNSPQYISNGCDLFVSSSASVLQYSRFDIKSVFLDPVCSTGLTGSIALTVTGGNSPYSYAWSPPISTSNVASSLSATFPSQNVYSSLNSGGLESSFEISNLTGVNPDDHSIDGLFGSITLSYIADPSSYLALTCDQCIYNFATPQLSFSARTDSPRNFTLVFSLLKNTPSGLTEPYSFGTNLTLTTQWSNFSYDISDTPYDAFDGFQWANVETYSQGTIYFDNINLFSRTDPLGVNPSGNYSVTIQDSKQCSVSLSLSLQAPPALLTTVVSEPVSCFSGSDGSLLVEATGGSPPYTYLWSPGSQNTSKISNLPTNIDYTPDIIAYSDGVLNPLFVDWSWAAYGTYSLRSDNLPGYIGHYSISFEAAIYAGVYFHCNNLCVDTYNYAGISFWINGGAAGGQQISMSVLLQLSNDPNADSQKIGPSPYINDIMVGYPENTPIPTNTWVNCWYDFSLLPPGMYDGFWFQAEENQIQPAIYIDDIIMVSKADDQPSKKRSTNQYVPYSVTVTDSKGCTSTQQNLYVTQPEIISAIFNTEPPKCSGLLGSVSSQTTGGTPPYTYLYSVISSNSVFNTSDSTVTLGPGVYTIQVIDSNQCTSTQNVSLPSSAPLVLTQTVNQGVSCYGGDDGILSALASGGVAPYNYTWVTSIALNPINSTGPDTYLSNTTSLSGYRFLPYQQPLVVYDDILYDDFSDYSWGTYDLEDSTIPPHTGIYSASFVKFNASALFFGCADQCIDLTIYQGLEFYISFGPLKIGNILPAMNFSIVKYVKQGASIPVASWNLTEATGLTDSVSQNTWYRGYLDFVRVPAGAWGGVFFADGGDLLFSGATVYIDSVILVPLKGGPRPTSTSYSSTPISVPASVQGSIGSYDVWVTDSFGCQTSLRNLVITQPSALGVSVFVQGSALDTNTGSISLFPRGGTPPYNYTWSLNIANPGANLTDLQPGSYAFEVSDSHSCILSGSTTVRTLSSQELVKQSTPLVAALFVIAGACTIFGIVAGVILLVKWTFFSPRSSLFCLVIVVGVLIGYVSVFFIVAKPTKATCTIIPWLIGIAFMLTYGALFLKSWRIWRILKNAESFKRGIITNQFLLRVLCVLLLLEIGYLIAWTIVDPPTPRTISLIGGDFEVECSVMNKAWWIVFVGYKAIGLMFGIVLSLKTRRVYQEYNESKQIALCIYNIGVVGLFAFPLVAILHTLPAAIVVLLSISILVSLTFTLITLFVGSWIELFGDGGEDMSNIKMNSFANKASTSAYSRGNTYSSAEVTPSSFSRSENTTFSSSIQRNDSSTLSSSSPPKPGLRTSIHATNS